MATIIFTTDWSVPTTTIYTSQWLIPVTTLYIGQFNVALVSGPENDVVVFPPVSDVYLVNGEGPAGRRGPVGDKGDKGDPGDGIADPGDLTLIFNSNLI